MLSLCFISSASDTFVPDSLQKYSISVTSLTILRELTTIYNIASVENAFWIPNNWHPKNFPLMNNQDSNITMPYIYNNMLYKMETACIWNPHASVLLFTKKKMVGQWGFMPEFFFFTLHCTSPAYQIRFM